MAHTHNHFILTFLYQIWTGRKTFRFFPGQHSYLAQGNRISIQKFYNAKRDITHHLLVIKMCLKNEYCSTKGCPYFSIELRSSVLWRREIFRISRLCNTRLYVIELRGKEEKLRSIMMLKFFQSDVQLKIYPPRSLTIFLLYQTLQNISD